MKDVFFVGDCAGDFRVFAGGGEEATGLGLEGACTGEEESVVEVRATC